MSVEITQMDTNLLTESDHLRATRMEKEFEKIRSNEILKAEKRRLQNEIFEIKHSNPKTTEEKPKRDSFFEKAQTTKLIIAFILINCTAVEVYAMVAMFRFQELSALPTLITTVIAESISFAIYCAKSFLEKREEERVQLERDQMTMEEKMQEGYCDSEDAKDQEFINEEE